jgi:hypothetical protein
VYLWEICPIYPRHPLDGECEYGIVGLHFLENAGPFYMPSYKMAQPKKFSWNRKILTMGILSLSIILIVSVVSYINPFHSERAKTEIEAPHEQVLEAELVSASGTVLLRKPGRPEWQEVKTGARFEEGSLLRTDISGSADIRFADGATVFVQENTVFTVQNTDDGAMEISPPPQMALLVDETDKSGKDSRNVSPGNKNSEEMQPSIELQHIIPFGRSLELIGNVEAGSKLVVNGESVEVGGDGSYKHFTSPFPSYARKVNLVMKVTNLAGRSRTLRTTYDFGSHGEEN